MKIVVSGVRRLEDSKIGFQKHFDTFEAAAAEFSEDFVETETKDGIGLYSFAEYTDTGVRRSKNTVVFVTALALDFDDQPMSEVEKVLALLDEEGISYWWHTTFSHRGDAKHARLRLVVKVSRPVHGAEWAPFWSTAVMALEAQQLVDQKCKDPCRLFYPPCGPSKDVYKFRFEPGAGAGLDVDEILSAAPEGAMAELSYDPVPEGERAEITDSLRASVESWVATLCAEIKARPYPGPMYDLKRQRVWSIARRAPHIIAPESILNRVSAALHDRYEKHDAGHEFSKAIAVVSKAIHEGMENPWWPRVEDTQSFHPLDASGLAARMWDANGADRLRWVQESQVWFYYDGMRWVKGPEGAMAFALEVATAIEKEERTFYAEAWQARETLDRVEKDPNVDAEEHERAKQHHKRMQDTIEKHHKFIKACRNATHLPPAIEFYKALPGVCVDLNAFDANPYVYNCPNGTLDLRTLKLKPHDPKDLLTAVGSRPYAADAECPRFETFLDEVTLGDPKLKKLLLQAMGYTLTGLTVEQKFVILQGDGEDGKTTLLGALAEAMSGLAGRTSANNFVEKTGSEAHPTWLMRLRDKRYVWAEEPAHFRKLDEALVKDLTGGSPVVARWMRTDETSFEVKFKLWLATNHLPRIDNVDHGIWRRIAVIPFHARFVTKTALDDAKIEAVRLEIDPAVATKHLRLRDSHLQLKLKEEAPGILALVARQAQLYLRGEDIEWLTVQPEIDTYRKESHPLHDFFLRECLSKQAILAGEYEVDSTVANHLLAYEGPWHVARTTLYDAYADWCKLAQPMSATTFYKLVKEKFRQKFIHGERMFDEVRLQTPAEKQLIRRGGPARRGNN